MLSFFFVFFAFILPNSISNGGSCPEKYLRFHKQHTFCLPENQSCHILVKGLQDEESEISEILKEHNEYRSRVATGQEKLGGGLPAASNMIELEWDRELQEIAQKLAEQCNFDHDCPKCRKTEKFSVGQNLYISMYGCEGNCEIDKPDWKRAVKYWYDEVTNIEQKYLKSYEKPLDGTIIEHFTQVSWAETWKIGCGYVAYKDQGEIHQFYVCNYGPTGNIKHGPVYRTGAPCSSCPVSSCCGETCKGKKTYPGLCQLSEPPRNLPNFPIQKSEKKPDFNCTFPECFFQIEGSEEWGIVETSRGNSLRVFVGQSSSSTIRFWKQVKPGSCFKLVIEFKSGLEKEDKQNFLKVPELIFDIVGKTDYLSYNDEIHEEGTYEAGYEIDLDERIEMSITVEVPGRAPAQLISIHRLDVYEGGCLCGKPAVPCEKPNFLNFISA